MTKTPSWEQLIGAPDMRFFPNRLDLGWTSSRDYGSIMILVRYEGTGVWYQHVFPAHAGDGTVCPERLEHLAGPLKELAMRAPRGTQTMELYAAPLGPEFPEAMILLAKNRPENPMRHMCKIGSIPIKHPLFAEHHRRPPIPAVPEDRDIKEHSFPEAAPIQETETARPRTDENNGIMREPDDGILTGLERLLAWVGRIDIPWPESKPKTEQLTDNETTNGNNHKNESTTPMNEPTNTPPPKPAPLATYTCVLAGNTLSISGLPGGMTEVSLRVILDTEMNSPVCELYQAIKQGAGLKVVNGTIAIENLFWRMGRFFAGHPATDKSYLLRVTPETDLVVLKHQDLPISGTELAEFVKGSLAGEGAQTEPTESGATADTKPQPENAGKLAELSAENALLLNKATKAEAAAAAARTAAEAAQATANKATKEAKDAADKNKALLIQLAEAQELAEKARTAPPANDQPEQPEPEGGKKPEKKASGWNKPVSGKVVWSVMAVLIALIVGFALWSNRDKGVDVSMKPLDDLAAQKQRAIGKMLGDTNQPSQHVPKFKGVMPIPPQPTQASAANVAEDERAILARGLSSQERAVFDQAMMLLKEIDLQKRASVPINNSVTNNGNGNSGNANGNNNTGNGVQFIYAPVINPVQTNVIVAPHAPGQSHKAKDSACTDGHAGYPPGWKPTATLEVPGSGTVGEVLTATIPPGEVLEIKVTDGSKWDIDWDNVPRKFSVRKGNPQNMVDNSEPGVEVPYPAGSETERHFYFKTIGDTAQKLQFRMIHRN